MKTILQHDEKDCGAACLAMIAKHYGYDQSINVFRNITNTDYNGTSMYDIMRAAESIGFSTEGLYGNIEELVIGIERNDIHLPFIAHTLSTEGYYHFVVVSGLSKDKVIVLDPAKGRINISREAFSKIWTGKIIELKPAESFKEHKRSIGSFLGFFSLLNGQIKSFSAIILMSVIISIIGILGAFVFQLVIDNSVEITEETIDCDENHHVHEIEFLTRSESLNTFLERSVHSFSHLDSNSISFIFSGLIGLYFLATIIQYIRARLIIIMSKEIDLKLIIPYFDRIMDMPLSKVLKRKTGDYLSRYNDASVIRNVISSASITMIIDATIAFGCGLILIKLNTKLALISIMVILLYVLIVLVNMKKIKDSNREFMENSAIVQSFIKENIDGIESVKAVNAESIVKNNMCSKFNAYLETAVKRSRIVMGQDTLVSGIEIIGITVLLWRGFLMVIQGELSLGSLITFYILLGYLITPVKNLIELLPSIQSAYVANDRLKDILEAEQEKSEGDDLTKVDSIDRWDVSNVCFHYDKQGSLLKSINFTFEKGEKVALIGKSGSGKTTLAKLFASFYLPESGEICANGVPLSHYSKESVRNTVAYVGGDASLFSGTVMDNLKMGNPDCSTEEICKLSDELGITKMINELPDGFQSYVEQGGINMSKGQRQRISILRALLKDPKLLVLDEATSNMDVETERELLDSIRKINNEIAIIMVTHNLSSIRDYDKIVILDDGKVDVTGKHDELLNSSDIYRDLLCG